MTGAHDYLSRSRFTFACSSAKGLEFHSCVLRKERENHLQSSIAVHVWGNFYVCSSPCEVCCNNDITRKQFLIYFVQTVFVTPAIQFNVPGADGFQIFRDLFGHVNSFTDHQDCSSTSVGIWGNLSLDNIFYFRFPFLN